jgi:predicted branched-subunit amino acid permease
MKISQIYILTVAIIVVLLLLTIFIANRKRKTQEITLLSVVAIFCVMIGFVFGEHPLIGYGFIGTGIVLAIIDLIFRKPEDKGSK